MNNEQREIERVKRLREQQIGARDPRAKDRRLYDKVGSRPRYALTSKEILNLLGARFTWMLWGAGIGLVWGVIVGILLDITFNAHNALFITLGGIFFSGGLGYYFGSLKDSGKEGWK